MWEHKPSHREMLLWSQCSKQATSLGEQTGSTERTSATARTEQYNQECHCCGPCFELNLPRFHSETACERLETTKLITLSYIPEVVWQQPPEISMDNFKLIIIIIIIAATVTTQTALIIEPGYKTDVELQRSSIKGILLNFPEPLRNSCEKMKEATS